MSNDELEEKGLMLICKHCNSANIVSLSQTEDMCGNCGTVNYTKVVTEEELRKIQESDILL